MGLSMSLTHRCTSMSLAAAPAEEAMVVVEAAEEAIINFVLRHFAEAVVSSVSKIL